MGDDRAGVYLDDTGNIVYRASAIGGCLTMLAAARQQLEPRATTEWQQAVYDGGNEFEAYVLTREHPPITHSQHEITLLITSRIKVVGHIDGVSDDRLVEIKSQTPELFASWTDDVWTTTPLWVKYAWQASCYMLALPELPNGMPSAGLELVRIGRNEDQPPIATKFYDQPWHSLAEIRARILEVESLAAQDEPLVCSTPDSFCPYPYLHPQLEPTDDPILEQLVADYQYLKTRQAQRKADMEKTREQIEKHLDGRPKVLLMSGITVTRSEYEIKEHMVKAGSGVRLTITEAKK